MNNPLAIIQARSTSVRLPNKGMKTINGLPLIEHVINGVALSGVKFVVAIPKDDSLGKYFLYRKIRFYEGSENDVLNRYYQCARGYGADPIVRITGDCWAVLPETIFYLTSMAVATKLDFISNTFKPKTVFEGNDVEIMSWRCLKWLNETAKDAEYREHVTNLIYENKELFDKTGMKRLAYSWNINLSNIKTSIDTPEDLKRANEMCIKEN